MESYQVNYFISILFDASDKPDYARSVTNLKINNAPLIVDVNDSQFEGSMDIYRLTSTQMLQDKTLILIHIRLFWRRRLIVCV